MMHNLEAPHSIGGNDYLFLDDPTFNGPYVDSVHHGRMQFFVEGVSCTRCVHRIEQLPQEVEGIAAIRLEFGKNIATVDLAPGGRFSQAAQALKDQGYTPHPIKSNDQAQLIQKKENRELLSRLGVAGACAGNIMLLTISIYAGAEGVLARIFEGLSFALFLPVVFYSAVPFYKTSWSALKNKKASIDIPIVAALLVGGALSTYHTVKGQGDIYFDSLATLVFLLLAARYFLKRVQQSYLSSSYLQPFFTSEEVEAWDDSEGGYVLKSPAALVRESRIRLKKGQRLPADGILLSAQAHINTAVLTGESYPQQVIAGQPVYAGCQVVSEQVEMTVSEMGHRTRVGQILEKIESELKNKTPLTSLVDKVAQYFTIIVLAAGFLFFVGYSFVDANEAVRRALALVILACPCALAFATPLTQSLSLIKAAKNSYLIKNAAVLEKLSRIKLVAFDKTGTLTRGEFKFLCWDYGEPSLEQQQIIHQLEASSQHPIALALKKELAPFVQSLPAIALEDWQEIEGRGVFATIKSRRYSMQAAPSRIRQRREFDFFVTRVGLYADDQLVCVAVLGDEPKADAVRTLRHIEELGATPMILSGDAKEAVLGLAKELSLSARQALADMSPEAKHQWVKDHPQTLMVGDGANDSLALASADVSVAVQGSMESSLEAADIYLATGGVTPIWHLIKLGQDTMHVVRRNLYISIVYNLIGGISALLGLINPLVAAVLMPISSAIVVMSSLYGTYFLRRLSRKGSYWQSNSLPTQEMGRHREQLA